MSKKKAQPTPGLIWERLETTGREKPLSRTEIVTTAIAIADSEGIDSITMRRIAAGLDSAAMSLYRHVASKEDLLDLMLDAAFGEIQLPDVPSGDWRGDLQNFARETRRVFQRHPWLIPLLTTRPVLGPNYLRWFEFSLAAASRPGLDIATVARMAGVLGGYITAAVGAATAEAEHNRRTGLSEDDKRRSATPYVEQVIATGRYPNFARWFQAGIQVDEERDFEFGLACLLDGFAAQFTGED